MENAILLGDINNDTTIDVLDIIICMGIILENIIPNEYEEAAANINTDNDINIQDIILIIEQILS